MKALYILLAATTLLACNKKQSPAPHHSISLWADGSEAEIPVEYMDAVWDYKTGELHIYAEGINHELLKLHLDNLHHTGTITNISEDNLYYTDDIEFSSAALQACSISIDAVTPQYASGSMKAALLNGNGRTDSKTVSCRFVIYSAAP